MATDELLPDVLLRCRVIANPAFGSELVVRPKRQTSWVNSIGPNQSPVITRPVYMSSSRFVRTAPGAMSITTIPAPAIHLSLTVLG